MEPSASQVSSFVEKRSDDIEREHLLALEDEIEAGDVSKPTKFKMGSKSIYQRLLLALDEHINVKAKMRVLRPCLEFILRLMLVATFLDDSFHTVLNLSEHLNHCNPLLLFLGLFVQITCSLSLLGLRYPDFSIKALIGWLIVQPLLFGQLSNFGFIAESLTVTGGLLVLHSHLIDHSFAPWVQIAGRMLLPTMYLHCAWHVLMSATTYEETNSFAMYIASLSLFIVYILVAVVLAISFALIAVGLKSRYIALLFGLTNLGIVTYQHPFFLYIWLEGGEWKYDEEMPFPKDVSKTTDLEAAYNLQRYYFFLGLSTSGALLLLAYIGPGEFAVQKDEILLPRVARAQD